MNRTNPTMVGRKWLQEESTGVTKFGQTKIGQHPMFERRVVGRFGFHFWIWCVCHGGVGNGGAPHVGHNFALLIPSPATVLFLSSLSWCLLVEFRWCLKRRSLETCRFEGPGGAVCCLVRQRERSQLRYWNDEVTQEQEGVSLLCTRCSVTRVFFFGRVLCDSHPHLAKKKVPDF